MIIIRNPEEIYQIKSETHEGTFYGRWHFSYEQYHSKEYNRFGNLEVFNDNTLSPGARWPMHEHRELEMITYCADGEFRHEDSLGNTWVLQKGWVQRASVGKGLSHSEINNSPSKPMRFIQIWFYLLEYGMEPEVQKKQVEREERTNKFLPIVSNEHHGALPLYTNAQIHSSFLQTNHSTNYRIGDRRGVYMYVLEGGPVRVNDHLVAALGAAKITDEADINVKAEGDAELLLVDVLVI